MNVNKIAILAENLKELDDLVVIVNKLDSFRDIYVHIILLSDIYNNTKLESILTKISFNYSVYRVENILNKPFKKYTFIEKVKLVHNYKKHLGSYLLKYKIELLLTGVQIIFQRVLYDFIQKNKVNIKCIVFHRHLLFDYGQGQYDNNLLYSDIIFKVLNLIGLGGYLIKNVGVGYADEYISTGIVTKDYLVDKGIDEKYIHCLGSLEFDNYKKSSLKENKNKNICFATSSPIAIGDTELVELQQKRIESYLKFFSKQDEFNMTIRVHPRDVPEQYDVFKNNYEFNLQISQGIAVLEEIDNFDILIGGISTLLFEALQIGSSVVFYVANDELHRYGNFIKRYNIPYVTDLKEYKKHILNKNNFPNYNEFFTIDSTSALDKITNYLIKKGLS